MLESEPPIVKIKGVLQPEMTSVEAQPINRCTKSREEVRLN
jgi:hypothetical protein